MNFYKVRDLAPWLFNWEHLLDISDGKLGFYQGLLRGKYLIF